MKILRILLPAALLCCCSRPAPIPRPEAYPRVEVYLADYRPVDFGPVDLMVNDSPRVDSLSPQWFNIVYPAYGVTVNCTLTVGDDWADVIANRRERIGRNLGDRPAQVASAPGRELIVAPTALSTPVQFIMTDSASYVLSGVAVSSWGATVPPDSVKPQIEALAVDLAHILK